MSIIPDIRLSTVKRGTQLGGAEGVDQVFHTSEDLPEGMQEHCEKEHADDCQALMNMRDEDFLDVVSMIKQYSDYTLGTLQTASE